MELPATLKAAALKPEVELQPHQERLEGEAREAPLRKLLVHALGSGKSLSGIAAAEARGGPYTALAPASLRQNYKKEIAKFTDGGTPADVVSYTELAKGHPVPKGRTLILDEAHNLRNPGSRRSQAAVAASDRAEQVLLLSGSPVVNRPGDLAVPVRMLTGKQFTPAEFEARYVTAQDKYPGLLRRLLRWPSGRELAVNHEGELRALLRGHVDWHDPGKPVVPTSHEDVPVTMSDEQHRLYQGMWDKLPWHVKWKLRNDTSLTEAELRRTMAFLTGPRQAGLSVYPYMRTPDPLKAFDSSAKLREAHRLLRERLVDGRAKALVFSNFIDAGLRPYSAALERSGLPNAVFHGGLSDAERKKLVEDYNADRLRVALLGPSGTEGLSFRGTQLVQLLDPHFNPVRPRQSVGRGLRYDSHFGLPESLRHVHVQRFLSRSPPGLLDRFLGRVGFDRTGKTLATDDHLAAISRRKEELNHKFMDLLRRVGTEGK